MRKKDYEFLASALLACKPDALCAAGPYPARAIHKGKCQQWETTVTIITDRLACQPSFDSQRFLAACGM